MRRNIRKDQSIYHFCYFPNDLKGQAIGNKSYSTDHFNGENGKWQLSITHPSCIDIAFKSNYVLITLEGI